MKQMKCINDMKINTNNYKTTTGEYSLVSSRGMVLTKVPMALTGHPCTFLLFAYFRLFSQFFLKYLLHHKTQIKRMKNEKITYEQNKYKYSITKTNIGEYPLVSFLGMALTKYQWLSKGIYVSLLCSYFVICYYYLMYLFKY